MGTRACTRKRDKMERERGKTATLEPRSTQHGGENGAVAAAVTVAVARAQGYAT